MTDVLRWLTLIEGAFVLGSLFGLYERIGRFVLPVRTMRVVFVATSMLVLLAVIDVYANLGERFQWRAPFAAVTFTLYLGGLGSLWWFYRGETGRIQRHDLAERFALSKVERALRLSQTVKENEGHEARAMPSWLARLFGG